MRIVLECVNVVYLKQVELSNPPFLQRLSKPSICFALMMFLEILVGGGYEVNENKSEKVDP